MLHSMKTRGCTVAWFCSFTGANTVFFLNLTVQYINLFYLISNLGVVIQLTVFNFRNQKLVTIGLVVDKPPNPRLVFINIERTYV